MTEAAASEASLEVTQLERRELTLRGRQDPIVVFVDGVGTSSRSPTTEH